MATISKSLPILCNRSLTLQSCKQIKCITFAHNFGNDAKDKERRQRHQRTAAAVVAAAGASAVPGNGASAMDASRGGIAGPTEASPKPHQMAPPESPFGTGQPPVVRLLIC